MLTAIVALVLTLGLHLIAIHYIAPQDPFMFSGTVRSNLDPFSTYNEPDLWRVLDAVGLKDTICGLTDKLDARVVDGGNNFSQVRSAARCSCGSAAGDLVYGLHRLSKASLPLPDRDRGGVICIRAPWGTVLRLHILHVLCYATALQLL
jgi:hypothetical protein